MSKGQAKPEARDEKVQQDLVLTGLRLAIFGAVLLPLAPIWTCFYTLLALVWIWREFPSGKRRLFFAYLAAALIAIYMAGWINSAVSAPADHVINSFIYVFGLPVGVWPSAAALALQIMLVCGLAFWLWPQARKFERLYIFAALGFAGWSVLSALAAIAENSAPRADVVLIAAAVWVNWSCLGLLSAGLVRSHGIALQLVRTLIAAVAILAVGMAIQLVIGDFSYVLASADPADFFERVRGSYYYHAPPVQMIAVALPLALTFLLAKGPLRAAGVLVIVGLGAVVLLNSTRGLSLALASGMGVFIALVIIAQRRPKLAILPVVLLAVLLSQIFYVKPGTVPVDVVATSEASVPGGAAEALTPSPTNVETFVSANGYRSGLASAGLSAIGLHPILGVGPGNAKIKQRENEVTETSSHVLGLDIAIMLGVPGFLLFVLALGLPAGRLLADVLLAKNNNFGVFRAAILTSLIVFAVSSLFHPQERSEIIAIIFLLSGLAIATSRLTPASENFVTEPPASGVLGFTAGAFVIVIGFVGCLVVTSPSYVFPAIEFVLRYRQALAERPTDIATNSPPLGVLVSAGLRLSGITTNVRVLADDPAELSAPDSFILWSPSREKLYPRIREATGIASQLRYGQWTAINIPQDWWLLDDFQPNLQFFKAGPSFEVPIAVNGLEAVPLVVGKTFVFTPELSPEAESSVDLTLHGTDGNTGLLEHQNVKQTMRFNVPATATLSKTSAAKLEISGLSAGGLLTVTERPPLLPSLTPNLRVRSWVDGVELSPYDSRNLNDLADVGGIQWPSTSQAIVEFTGENVSFGAYRLRPTPNGARLIPLPESWIIEGLRRDGTWTQLDKRSLGQAVYSDVGYFAATTGDFVAVRLRFNTPGSKDLPDFVGLGEIELFPLAATTTR